MGGKPNGGLEQHKNRNSSQAVGTNACWHLCLLGRSDTTPIPRVAGTRRLDSFAQFPLIAKSTPTRILPSLIPHAQGPHNSQPLQPHRGGSEGATARPPSLPIHSFTSPSVPALPPPDLPFPSSLAAPALSCSSLPALDSSLVTACQGAIANVCRCTHILRVGPSMPHRRSLMSSLFKMSVIATRDDTSGIATNGACRALRRPNTSPGSCVCMPRTRLQGIHAEVFGSKQGKA